MPPPSTSSFSFLGLTRLWLGILLLGLAGLLTMAYGIAAVFDVRCERRAQDEIRCVETERYLLSSSTQEATARGVTGATYRRVRGNRGSRGVVSLESPGGSVALPLGNGLSNPTPRQAERIDAFLRSGDPELSFSHGERWPALVYLLTMGGVIYALWARTKVLIDRQAGSLTVRTRVLGVLKFEDKTIPLQDISGVEVEARAGGRKSLLLRGVGHVVSESDIAWLIERRRRKLEALLERTPG